LSDPRKLDPKELKTMEQYNNSLEWFMSKYDEIKDTYRGKFVGVYNGSVLDSDEDLNKLKRKIEEKVNDKDSVFKKYVSERDDLLIV